MESPVHWPLIVDSLLVLAAVALALGLRPWRAVTPGGPPWPWLALWVLLPLLWAMDRHARVPIALPVSGASLLVLMAGWPLAVLAMLPAAAVLPWSAGLPLAEALHRLAWLGVVPGTLALLWGATLRRWLPHHLFVYILGRGFFGTAFACVAAAALSLAVQVMPAGTTPGDWLLGRLLAAFGEAFLTGMLCAIGVAFHPEWLATYADRLYLPRPPRG
ncbi:hypothetical protein [Aquabacterium sp.]|uniref:hypothetical protein n=1 Tax=Aquabacterium sp. TaxID=1872578 RepID=UPI003784BA85